jgi:hypothetical protein
MALTSNKRRPIIVGPTTPLDPKETDLWIDTDNNKIYRWDGSEWALVSDGVTQAYIDTAVTNLVDSAPGLLNTLNELAAAIGDDANFATTIGTNLTTASTNLLLYTDSSFGELGSTLSGLINTASVGAQTAANSYTDGEINTLESSLIGTIATASGAAVTSANGYTDSEIGSIVTTNVAEGTNLYFTSQRAIDSGSATYLTQSAAALDYLPVAGGTVTGPVDFTSDVTFSGSVAYLNTENLLVDDPLIYLAQNNTETDALDSGFTTAYGEGVNTGESHLHRGLVYDNSANTWKLASNFPHPTTNEVDFSSANYDAITLGSASVTGTVSASAFVGDGSGLTGINLSVKKDKLNSFNARVASYVLVLGDADKIVEMSVAGGNTLTVPNNDTVAYPVGTEITILQTGAGQVTLTPALGVTINATPGLKLRAQWASATIIKRSTNVWVAIGDLSA